jgi:acetyl esterase/lipase
MTQKEQGVLLETAASKPVIPLWPPDAPGIDTTAVEGQVEPGKFDNIRNPTLTVYAPPDGSGRGAGVVICPGGAYSMVSCINEGYPTAEWLNTLGITAFVLKYRLPNTQGPDYSHPVPLSDIQQAIRIVREQADKYGLCADRTGVTGFSAGGHLAAMACTLFDRPVHTGAISCRPDFAILIYAVICQLGTNAHIQSRDNLTGPDPSQELIRLLSPDSQVTSHTPPMFLAHSKNDEGVPYQNSVTMAEALRAHNVPCELHLYEQGGHGFGLGEPGHDCSQWPAEADRWLKAVLKRGVTAP